MSHGAITPDTGQVTMEGQQCYRLHLIDQDTVRAPHVEAGKLSGQYRRQERTARNQRVSDLRQSGIDAEDIGEAVGLSASQVRRIW